MPFVSQVQRGLFRAARTNPEVRKRFGLKLEDVKAMIEKDEPGKLPKYRPGADGILIAISKRPGRSGPNKGEVNAMRLDIGKALIQAIKEDDAAHAMECLDLAMNLREEMHESDESEPDTESGSYEE